MTSAGGKTAYLYGTTRIGEQQSAGWMYHLSDALGSVRQLVDSDGQVTLVRGYTPHGEPLWSEGTGQSCQPLIYGFKGYLMKAPSKRSLCIDLCWLVAVLGRSAVYSSGQNFSMGVSLAADIIAVLLGLLVGIDVILAPDLSVVFWLNKRWYSPSQIQVAGWLFLGGNVLLGVMAICTAARG